MDKIPEWISAIGTAITALGIILLWIQTSLAKDTLGVGLKTMKVGSDTLKVASDTLKVALETVREDHERSRRESAINY